MEKERNKDVKASENNWTWWLWLMTGLSLAAFVLSAILSWHYLSGISIAGCGGEVHVNRF
jgi:hypothetical protein